MDLTQNIYYEYEDQDKHENEGHRLPHFGDTSPKLLEKRKLEVDQQSVKPGEKKQGIGLCSKLSKEMRDLLKHEEEDAQILLVGNAKAKETSKGKAPNYEKIRTSLLDKEQSKVQRALNPLMQDRSTHGLSIASDGWSNLKNQQLINTMAMSGGRAVFVNGHDVSGMEKNGLNIAEFIFKAIDFVGPSNVVQVVTDNASHCKAAGAIIQEKHPHIF
ncbi:hypothetical protein Acr_20g0006980 [Actinidia rufa]|uniref:DUF659 domain-containing protein n=1 Tax=Actinidia rufa TaxID=165716 RepID=A0A7J0GDJ3_9ERIC|nr:hypothetical protein Acr_20g0006980 [Actinidia rufa]